MTLNELKMLIQAIENNRQDIKDIKELKCNIANQLKRKNWDDAEISRLREENKIMTVGCYIPEANSYEKMDQEIEEQKPELDQKIKSIYKEEDIKKLQNLYHELKIELANKYHKIVNLRIKNKRLINKLTRLM